MDKSGIKKRASTVAVEKIVMSTIRKYGAPNGMSLSQLKEKLRGRRGIDLTSQNSEINLALKQAIDRGVLTREGDLYKLVQKVPKRKQKVYCVICLKDWGAGCKRLMTLPCKHVFCRPCIQKWLKQVNTCPSCRTIV